MPLIKFVSPKIAAASNVDEETWGAVSVSQVTPQGQITQCEVAIYDPGGGFDFFWPADFPISVPLNWQMDAFASYQNTGAYEQIMWLTVSIIDPDGLVRAQTERYRSVVASGDTRNGPITPVVILDKEGMWQVHALLEAELPV